jgi:hypothetical protein
MNYKELLYNSLEIDIPEKCQDYIYLLQYMQIKYTIPHRILFNMIKNNPMTAKDLVIALVVLEMSGMQLNSKIMSKLLKRVATIFQEGFRFVNYSSMQLPRQSGKNYQYSFLIKLSPLLKKDTPINCYDFILKLKEMI